jgi:hypothetical protein
MTLAAAKAGPGRYRGDDFVDRAAASASSVDRKKGEMGEGAPGTGPVLPAETTVPPAVQPDVVRHGPGVPASQAGAESVWRTGRRGGPSARRVRLRRRLGLALTVILLAAAGLVVWLRFFDHPPFHVTGVGQLQETRSACTVDVTGQIATNGSAGTISYQWVFRPQAQAPQPLSQSVTAGQHTVSLTVAVEGQGHGSVHQTVTLDVLGPDAGSASAAVGLSC